MTPVSPPAPAGAPIDARIDAAAVILDEARSLVAKGKFVDLAAIEIDISELSRAIAGAPEANATDGNRQRWIAAIAQLTIGLDRLEGEVTEQIRSIESNTELWRKVGAEGAYIAQESQG